MTIDDVENEIDTEDYAGSKEGQKEKLEYDLYYIQNQSILFDLFIILKTVQTVLFRRGQ
jgi:lipopolysaccharide/colanic/teichoic acid biosynthesis glycosyltransferase